MLWDYINKMWLWVIQVFKSFETLWNYSFEIGEYTITFQSILTSSLLLVVGLLLVKKLI